MNPSTTLEMRDENAVLRATGEVSLAQAVQIVKVGIHAARQQGAVYLLADVIGLTGFDPPSLTARYFFIQEWAEVARGIERFVVVAQAKMIDPNKFGVTVAANAGLTAEIFASEVDAEAWLQAPQRI
jgi:hypothetical protein